MILKEKDIYEKNKGNSGKEILYIYMTKKSLQDNTMIDA